MMAQNVRIHFEAVYLPRVKKFRVQVKTKDRRWVELKTAAAYVRWARSLKDRAISIGGIDIKLNDKKTEEGTKKYFLDVAQSYINWVNQKKK